jgi:hypothetical protein
VRYFFDTEFIDSPDIGKLTLISIGVVAEDGREFYAVSSEFAEIYASEWVKANVLTRLQPKRSPMVRRLRLEEIRADLLAFIGDDAPEFWAYYGAHDWVALCWLMGGMLNLPQGWPWLCRELRTTLNAGGLADFKDDGRDDEHNALADARWVRDAFTRVVGRRGGSGGECSVRQAQSVVIGTARRLARGIAGVPDLRQAIESLDSLTLSAEIGECVAPCDQEKVRDGGSVVFEELERERAGAS